jgi:mannosyltransferase
MKLLKGYTPLLILFLLNVLIKCLYLTSEPVSHDEPFTIYHAQFSFSDLVGYLKNYNNPPLFEIILHLWIKVFGISELSVRVLPMLFSSASVMFIYLIGRDFFTTRVALLASLLFTFSTMQIWYAHDCRVYSLFLLLTLSSFYLFFTLLKEGGLSRKHSLGLILINVLLIYAHYFGLFVWLLQGIIILAFHFRNKKLLLQFIGIMIGSSLLYLPQVFSLYERFSDSAGNGTWLAPPVGLESLYNMIWSFSNAPLTAVLCITLLVVALGKFLIFSKNQQAHRPILYLCIWFVFPFLSMFVLSYSIPMFLDRYLIYITPAFYLLLAISLSFLLPGKKTFYAGSTVLIACFLVTVSFNPSKKRAVRETVDFVASRKDPATLVLICPPEFMTTFAYYYQRKSFEQVESGSEYDPLIRLLEKDQVFFINALSPELMEKASHYKRIIYLDAGADFTFPGNHIKDDLLKHFTLKEEVFKPELFHVYVLEVIEP